ncbi:MAG: tetratricopeptide repeat protein [Treponema sp.]|jgi:tetratricopeptide (TPR) repeat protein|nr:tetratricopeptide repeat protein [Treponema sp.]
MRASLPPARRRFRPWIILGAVILFSCDSRKSGEAERAYLAAAEAYGGENYREALAQARRALKADRGFYQAEFLLGKALYFAGEEAEALAVFSRLAKRRPEYTEARLWRIRCLVLGGRYGEAESLLDRELSFNFSDWRPLYLYALLARKTGDYEKRLSMGRQAETALSDSAKLYLDLALAWQALGLNDRAAGYLEKAKTVSGSSVPFGMIEETLKQFTGGEP